MSQASVVQGAFGRVPFREVVVGDTETTGLAPYGVRDAVPKGERDRLCSAAFLRLRLVGDAWRIVGTLSFLCDPGRPIPEAAASVNGFHWSGDGSSKPGRLDLCGVGSFADAWRDLGAPFVGDLPLVFHNAVFDAAVIDAECDAAGMEPLRGPVLCTKKAFADLRGLGRPDHYVPGTNLNALCDLLGVDRSGRRGPDGEELHGAAVDARMAAGCFAALDRAGWMLAEDAAELPHRTLPERGALLRLVAARSRRTDGEPPLALVRGF